MFGKTGNVLDTFGNQVIISFYATIVVLHTFHNQCPSNSIIISSQLSSASAAPFRTALAMYSRGQGLRRPHPAALNQRCWMPHQEHNFLARDFLKPQKDGPCDYETTVFWGEDVSLLQTGVFSLDSSTFVTPSQICLGRSTLRRDADLRGMKEVCQSTFGGACLCIMV